MFKGKKKLYATLGFASAISSGWVTVGAANDYIEPPTVSSITGGYGVQCPTDPEAPNPERYYGALILYRNNNETPLWEGMDYDPFDGTYIEMTGNNYVQGDKYFMRAFYFDNQYDSDKAPPYRKMNAVPSEVKDAVKNLRQALKNMPRPEIAGEDLSTTRKLTIHLPGWIAPTVNIEHANLTLAGYRAALKRTALGPNGQGVEDNIDRKWHNSKWTAANGQQMNVRIISNTSNTLLYGPWDDVFGKSAYDQVEVGRHYRYRAEVFADLEYKADNGDVTTFHVAIGGKPLTVNVKRNGTNPVP
jgi:hypothetical protein